jgi:hypothetical protein
VAVRRFLIAAACALCVSFAWTPAVVGTTSTTCVLPSFRGHNYRPHALKSDLSVAERIGTAVFYRNWNLNCFREERFVYRLRGIAVRHAVSVDGSSRRLLIRFGICTRTHYEAALVRCLKRR